MDQCGIVENAALRTSIAKKLAEESRELLIRLVKQIRDARRDFRGFLCVSG